MSALGHKPKSSAVLACGCSIPGSGPRDFEFVCRLRATSGSQQPYSITSSASASRIGGKVMPSALAALPIRTLSAAPPASWRFSRRSEYARHIRQPGDTRPGGSCRNSSIRPAYLPAAAHRRRRNLVGDVSVYIDILSYGCSERTYLKALLMPQCSCIKQ